MTVAEFAADLRRTATRLRDTTSLMKQCAEAMAESVRQNVEQGHDPDGRPFAALKYRDGTPLFDTGGLAGSIQPSWTADSASAGTDHPFAGVHNEGLTVPEKSRGPQEKPWVFDVPGGRTIFTRHIAAHDIPAREFAGWGEPLLERVTDIITDYAIDAFKGQ